MSKPPSRVILCLHILALDQKACSLGSNFAMGRSSQDGSSPQGSASCSATIANNSRKRKLVDHQEVDASVTGEMTLKSARDRIQALPTMSESSRGGEKKQRLEKRAEEKRLRVYRKKAPKSFLEKLDRAQTQRMIVIGRTRSGTEAQPAEEIDIVGSTGNIYRVTIGPLPSCTCPDHRKGNECKHKVYALHTVLKAPDHLQYQLAFISSELREIFARAPPIPAEAPGSENIDGTRKAIEGDCPICYMDFEPDRNELVWCKAACGNNMHKSCFDKWAASQCGNTVRCVYCRTPWQIDHGGLESIKKTGQVNEEGYVNVAEHFGMSRARDYSSYHRPWVRRQFGLG